MTWKALPPGETELEHGLARPGGLFSLQDDPRVSIVFYFSLFFIIFSMLLVSNTLHFYISPDIIDFVGLFGYDFPLTN